MIICWKVKVVDPTLQTIGDRVLYVDTQQLPPSSQVAIEHEYELKRGGNHRQMLRFREYFKEESPSPSAWESGGGGTFSIPDYIEDLQGRELALNTIGEVLTGQQGVVVFPPGTSRHVIRYETSENKPIPLDKLTLSTDELQGISYFVRDLRELESAAFFLAGPGTYSSSGVLQTAVTDEEIRSFVTIFRRLYMEKDKGNFLRTSKLVCRLLGEHRLAVYINGWVDDYTSALSEPPKIIPFFLSKEVSFDRKRLLDIFIYTQYAHQPDKRRGGQYRDCLLDVGGNESLLFWTFLSELWNRTTEIINAGKPIEDFLTQYCAANQIVADTLDSISRSISGIGDGEKEVDRADRLLEQSETKLARMIWERAGRPVGGPTQFSDEARRELEAELGSHKSGS